MLLRLKKSHFFAAFLALWSITSHASLWEVGIVFAESQSGKDYAKDVERNIREIKKLKPNASFKLAFAKEKSNSTLADLSKSIFKDPQAKRILIYYGHGKAFDGVENHKLLQLKNLIETSIPKRPGNTLLDLLWFDACFMGNIETAYEFKDLTRYYMGSEDSEFSSGLPYDALSVFESEHTDELTLFKNLALRFIESYSFIRKGNQRGAVSTSSATISLIDEKMLKRTTEKIRTFSAEIVRLSDLERARILKSAPRRRTDNKELVDLGSLLNSLSKSRDLSQTAIQALNSLRSNLELDSKARFISNPRILARPTSPGQNLVFGFNHWSKGHKEDLETLTKLPDSMKPAGFLKGANQKSWPFRKVNEWAYMTPFSPGLNQMSYFFIQPNSGKIMSELFEFERTEDIATFDRKNPENPIVFSAYTQGIGKYAERYSGLSILDPTLQNPSFDYLDTEFAKLTNWAGL
jgi:hypothetical protein